MYKQKKVKRMLTRFSRYEYNVFKYHRFKQHCTTPCNFLQLLPRTLTTLPRPEPSICTAKRRLSAAIALSHG